MGRIYPSGIFTRLVEIANANRRLLLQIGRPASGFNPDEVVSHVVEVLPDSGLPGIAAGRATTPMTAAIPIVIRKTVKILRILFRNRVSIADRNRAPQFTIPVPPTSEEFYATTSASVPALFSNLRVHTRELLPVPWRSLLRRRNTDLARVTRTRCRRRRVWGLCR